MPRLSTMARVKTREDLDFACSGGARVNLDGPDEVADLRKWPARCRRDRSFRVGLRANIEIGEAARGRFGPTPSW